MPPAGQKAGKTTEKPLLVLRPQFSSLCVLARHPLRLAFSLVVVLALLPELLHLLQLMFGLSGQKGLLAAALLIFSVFFLSPLTMAALDCQAIRYVFYKDRLEMIESFFLRDKIRVQYRTITGLRIERSFAQRVRGLGDIILETDNRYFSTGKRPRQGQALADIRLASKQMEKIRTILRAYHGKDDKSS